MTFRMIVYVKMQDRIVLYGTIYPFLSLLLWFSEQLPVFLIERSNNNVVYTTGSMVLVLSNLSLGTQHISLLY